MSGHMAASMLAAYYSHLPHPLCLFAVLSQLRRQTEVSVNSTLLGHPSKLAHSRLSVSKKVTILSSQKKSVTVLDLE